MSTPTETGVGIITYSFSITSKCACPNACGGGGGSSSDLSFGSILCIILFVLISVYLIGGVLFLKYHKKQEGKDTIPNYEFWVDIPAKVKDGVIFTKGMVGGKKGNYEEI